MIPIPDSLKGSDIVYHYTKASTAVEYIFYKNRLRFSSILNSIDTIERSRFNTGAVIFGDDNSEMFKRTYNDKNELEKRIDTLLDTCKILCFCKNDNDDEHLSANIYRKDYFGFLKPRMWDQYGENYKGVCLAFSKSKLIENNVIEFSQDIKYASYEELDFNFNRINVNYLNQVGLDSYFEVIRSLMMASFAKKHKDYKDENEFRLLSFSESENFLDISESICGIIISPQLIQSDFILSQIVNYSNEKNIELIYLDWNKNGVTITTKDFW